MKIPSNITKEHILKAIEKIDKEGIPDNAESQYFDLVYDDKRYPPKVVLSYANIFANGEILDRSKFEGGLGTPCFKLLQKNGFIIEPRSFFNEIKKFLSQAQTNDLKTANRYATHYLGLTVNISFGMTNPAKIPWIAFLIDDQKVQNGIYPVFLFYKELNILILAFGLSETNSPTKNWNISNPKEIRDYFSEMNLGKPKHYGNSFIYKVYKTDHSLNETEINDDLNKIVEIYKQIFISKPSINLPNIPNKKFDHNLFFAAAKQSGLSISNNICLRFIASLLAKPFVILTGLSGSGKTKLAQAFAMWICENEDQYCIIPVGADWTNREPLLGFQNALDKQSYVLPENGALNLMLEAIKEENKNKPYFLILDEMNLSHVERYFADFLSVMESNDGKGILLHSDKERKNDSKIIPNNIELPKNLFIIGTVNIDETTYMFSPKVLDRASVIEFRVTAEEMIEYLGINSSLNLEILASSGATLAKAFVDIAKDKTLKTNNPTELQAELMTFFEELKKTGAEFGYRSASEIYRFAAVINAIHQTWTINEIIDASIMQKLLPKVHGSRRKLDPVLKKLGSLCLTTGEKFDDFTSPQFEIDFFNTEKIKYPISLEKILRMHQGLINNGFTSYAEA